MEIFAAVGIDFSQLVSHKKHQNKIQMKFFLCTALLATLAIVQVFAIAGQSACRDPSEVGQTYPHHFDPAKYWHCEKLNEPAEERDCPKDMAYMHLLKECIPWANWIWKQPPYPPTLA